MLCTAFTVTQTIQLDNGLLSQLKDTGKNISTTSDIILFKRLNG